MNTKMTTMIALVLASLVGAKGLATDFVWDGGGNGTSWSDANNWDLNSGNPDDKGDKATIDPIAAVTVTYALGSTTHHLGELVLGENATLTLSGSSGGELQLRADGTENGKMTVKGDGTDPDGVLNINADIKLRLDGAVTHEIGGDVFLVGSGSTISVANDVTFGAFSATDGSIVGQHADAILEIVRGNTLQNDISIEGMMQITRSSSGSGDGILDNQGDVIANAAGVLLLGADLDLADVAAASWKAIGNADPEINAILRFKVAVSDLAGAFECNSNGVLDFDASVTTTGCLTQPSGVDCVDASPSGVCFNWCGGADDCDGTS